MYNLGIGYIELHFTGRKEINMIIDTESLNNTIQIIQEGNKKIESAIEKWIADEEVRVKKEAEQKAKEGKKREKSIKAAKEVEAKIKKEQAIKKAEQPEVQLGESSGAIGNSWSEVSPSQAAAYMATQTGVSQARWENIIFAESSNNATVMNSIGCYGYLQLHPVHGSVSAMSPQQYLDTAVRVYHSQGIAAWEVTLKGMA